MNLHRDQQPYEFIVATDTYPEVSPLFTPVTVGSTIFPNRFVMPAMQRGWNEDGAPREELATYYRRRAEGGVSLIVSESTAIDHPSSTTTQQFAWLTQATASSWEHCIREVHAGGGRMFLQLWHEGGRREGDESLTISPSGLGHPELRRGRAATLEDLAELREAFVRSAQLAREIGADGIEIHCAHGYLLDQFLWPATNLREDEYGGPDVRNRIRFPAEIAAGIRAACGPDFLISCRFSQWKEHDFAARIVETPDELGVMLGALKDAGVNLLHASTRRFWSPEWQGKTFASWAQQVSGLPTIAVGSVGLDKDVMETFTTTDEVAHPIAESIADLSERIGAGDFTFISVGRSLIADPNFVEKVRRGDIDSIRRFSRSDVGLSDSEIIEF